MKIGKTRNKSGILKVLLGLAVAGALLFAACQNIFDLAEPKPQGESGFGYVVVSLEDDEARTIRPGIGSGKDKGAFTDIEYVFTGVGDDGEALEIIKTWKVSNAAGQSGVQVFMLPVGTYKLAVTGFTQPLKADGTYDNGTGVARKKAATGVYADGATFSVTGSGGEVKIKVLLTPVEDEGDGKLIVEVLIPTKADYVISLKQYVGKSGELVDIMKGITFAKDTTATTVPGDMIKINYAGDSSNGIPATTGLKMLPPGSYLLTGKINYVTSGNVLIGGFSEAVHIVSNLETKVKKDFVDPAEDGPLAAIQDSDDAINFLKEQLPSWISTSGLLASFDGVKFLPGTGSEPGTIQLNYLWSEVGKLGGNFPLRLQGGWKIATSAWGDSGNDTGFTVTGSGSETYKLVNSVVNATGEGFKTYNTRYNLEIRAVAEFKVEYGKNVPQSGRGITITGVDLGSADANGVRKAIAPIPNPLTTFEINVNNAALRINNSTAEVTAGKASYQTISQFVNIVIYETADDQFENGVAQLKREIASKTPGVAWIQDTNILAKVNHQDDTKDISNPQDQKPDTIIYYVADRVKASASSANDYSVEVRVPQDDLRWQKVDDVVLAHYVDATEVDPLSKFDSAGKPIKIGFQPWGGTVKYYEVLFKPVAEFVVDFYPSTTGAGKENDRDPLIPSTGKVTIKGPESRYAEVTLNDTTGKDIAPSFLLSSLGTSGGTPAIEISLNETTIMIDDLIATGSDTEIGVGSGIFRKKFDLQNAVRENQAKTNQNVIQGGQTGQSYKVQDLRSRQYTINVYPSLEKQQKAAVDKLAAETNSRDWLTRPNGSTTNAIGTVGAAGYRPAQRIETFSNRTTSTNSNTPPSSAIIYVGTALEEPVVKWPVRGNNDGDDAYIPKNGWLATSSDQTVSGIQQASLATAGDINANGLKAVTIKFQPKGGFSEPIYTFNLVRALEYEVKYVKYPIGNEYATGKITVAGLVPAGTSGQQYSKEVEADTPVGNASPELIGIGGSLRFTATSNIVKDVTSTHNGGAANQNATITVSDGDTKITIWVFPSTTEQTDNVRRNLRRVTSLNAWSTGADYGIVTVGQPLVASENENKTTFQVIASNTDYSLNNFDTANTVGIGINPVLEVPTDNPQFNRYFNPQAASADRIDLYGNTLVQGQASGDINDSDQTGVRSVKLYFTQMGGSYTFVYTFDMQRVARYKVNFNKGPNGTTDYQGTIKFKSFEKGKGTLEANYTDITSTSGSKEYIGGTGKGSTGGTNVPKLTIETLGGSAASVFSTNIDSNGRPATQNPPTTTYTDIDRSSTGTVKWLISDDYTIEVYPTISDQILQVQNMMKAVTGPLQDTFTSGGAVDKDVGWFREIPGRTSSTPATTFVGSLSAIAGNISEIQYWTSGNDFVPKVKIPKGFIATSADYLPTVEVNEYNFYVSGSDYNNNATSNGTFTHPEGYTKETQDANVDGYWSRVRFDFMPIGDYKDPSTQLNYSNRKATTVYSFRILPVAKFTMEFSPGARGQLSVISPKRKYTDPNDSTKTLEAATSKPGKTLEFQNVVGGKMVDYIAIGPTEIQIDGAPADVEYVDLRLPAGTTLSPPYIYTDPDKGVKKGTLTTTAREYTIRIFKQGTGTGN